MFGSIAIMIAALELGAGPEIVTWPMLLAGLGIGALASQLGSVTVSSVSDEQAGDVGGLQNTVTNLGASIGTALAGAVLISTLTTSFLVGIEDNSDVPPEVTSAATVELAAGIPFVSDAQLRTALDDADVPASTADAVVEANEAARIDGLRSSLAVLALIALIALFFTRRIPTDAASIDRKSQVGRDAPANRVKSQRSAIPKRKSDTAGEYGATSFAWPEVAMVKTNTQA